MRADYAKSFEVLTERMEIIGAPMPNVSRTPRHDDEELGPSIFRMGVEDVSLDGLTLPGLYVGRSRLARMSFRDSDLHLSTLNWSDFEECDFSEADLSRADLRRCVFRKCSFRRADLSKADLRASSFEACDFTEARLAGTLLYRSRRLLGLLPTWPDQSSLPLSATQRQGVAWSDEAPEPGGG